MDQKIVFIGAGSMAEAIIAGLTKSDSLAHQRIFVTNKSNQDRLTYLEETYGIKQVNDKDKIISESDIVVLAMKPKDMKDALSSIKSLIHSKQLILSVLAGTSTKAILKEINKEVPIIRVMPNTSALIGESATAISKGKYVEEYHMTIANKLLHTIGKTVTVEEDKMHAVTSISGSGPAYIYYLVEAMQKAAIDAGLEQDIAEQLIKQTIIGVGEMLRTSSEPVHILRENITSPEGTTEAGLNALKKHGFEKAITECVESARKRSLELGEEE